MAKDKLERNVSCFNAWAMIVGTIIGTGIFFKPQAVFDATGSASFGLLAWVIGCFMGLCGGLVFAEIGALIPETGGMMTYLEKIYSRVFGYMIAWSQMVAFYPIRIAAAAVVFGTTACALLGLDPQMNIPLACGLVVLMTLINYFGNSAASLFQNTATVLKFIPIKLIIVYGLFINDAPLKIQFEPILSESHPFWQGLAISVMATLYATDGWCNASVIAGEMKNPGRDLPKAIIFGILTVTAVYLIINIAYLKVMTPAQLGASATPGGDVATLLFGNFGGKLIAAGIVVSIMGSMTGFTRAAWRIPYALAIRNLLPCSAWFARLSSKTGMPVNSGIYILIASVSSILFFKKFNTLTDIGSLVIWVFYTLTFVGLFILRKKWADRPRPFRVPLYPITPIVGIISGLFVIISTIIYQPIIALYALILMGLGVPVYLYKRNAAPLADESDTDTVKVVKDNQ
ncbi:MAG: amino acid permease [Pluralibacter gergoviae]|nr:amino acid permease [Pluralibacter gergoviae]